MQSRPAFSGLADADESSGSARQLNERSGCYREYCLREFPLATRNLNHIFTGLNVADSETTSNILEPISTVESCTGRSTTGNEVSRRLASYTNRTCGAAWLEV